MCFISHLKLTLAATPFGILARRRVLTALEIGALCLCNPIRTATVLLFNREENERIVRIVM